MAINLKYAIEATIFWPPADRVVPTGYKKKMDADVIYPLIKKIEGCDGVELYYPYDFDDVKKMKKTLTDLNLPVSAIGIGFFGEENMVSVIIFSKSGIAPASSGL